MGLKILNCFLSQAKALADKNQRDVQAQREKEERHVRFLSSTWKKCILLIAKELTYLLCVLARA